ncbi:unnamed protein product [Candida verbasci]|uniref:Serine/threonine-protein phosphatase n=1 Tax=Candida verbasci TaxID=1227364 RepID=A0A9W4U0H5_9ASCO|nr:unnamed protein product [Candida verbasci]
MGNSPSKNDPLPKSSSNSSNNNSSTAQSNGNVDLDPDEMASALSQNKDKTRNSNKKNIIQQESISEGEKSLEGEDGIFKHIGAIDIDNNKTKKFGSKSINVNGAENDGTFNSPNKSSLSDLGSFDFDMDLKLSTSKNSKLSQDVASSLDSMGTSITSPIFTTLGNDSKDEDSLSSFNSSPTINKQVLDNSNLSNKLDSIAESKPLELNQKSKVLSKENLKKHNKTISTTLVKQSSTSSSNLSNSPPLIASNKKLDVDIDEIIKKLLHTKKNSNNRKSKDKLKIELNDIKYILGKSRQIFLEQPTLLRLTPSVKIVGDIHGQFFDLIRIFNCCGYPPHSNYLFLGDYVDRGEKSLETILLLLCYKIKYPENFFMLRGNHESANITKIYGFYDECKRRLNNNKIWKNFVDVFNTLPIAATINDKIFCVHGGLSPDLNNFEQIENIKRPTDVPDKGLLADLLWSDPDPSVKNFSLSNWPKNDRGVSFCFGRKHVEYFCSKFKLDLIVRGHMVVEDGYEFFSKRKLVTVFSAPNYCGEFNNFGAVMSVDKNLYCSFELIKPN